MSARVTVQYCAGGQYGEMTAKSEEMSVQEMVDEMFATGKPGISFRFISSDGIVAPTGFDGDVRLYISKHLRQG